MELHGVYRTTPFLMTFTDTRFVMRLSQAFPNAMLYSCAEVDETATTRSPLVIGVEDTEDSKPKDNRR